MEQLHAGKIEQDATATRVSLILAQLFSLVALEVRLVFVIHTTGGTLFLVD